MKKFQSSEFQIKKRLKEDRIASPAMSHDPTISQLMNEAEALINKSRSQQTICYRFFNLCLMPGCECDRSYSIYRILQRSNILRTLQNLRHRPSTANMSPRAELSRRARLESGHRPVQNQDIARAGTKKSNQPETGAVLALLRTRGYELFKYYCTGGD